MSKLGMNLFFAAFAACVASADDTWYVDAARYGASGSDGRSAATAFGTIQAAVTNAAAGDTIKVLPGTYDKDYAQDKVTDSCVKARVMVDRCLRIESTGGAAVTHIVGAADYSTRTDGLGDDAVRCVSVFQAAKGTVLKGFTFRDGHSRWYENKNCNATHGGAVQYLGYEGPGVTIADSVISNNVATRGGAVHRVNVVRTLLTHNRVSNNGGSVARNCLLYACVLAHNGDAGKEQNSRAAIADATYVVNCTLFGNGEGCVFCDNTDATKVYNSVLVLSGNNSSTTYSSIYVTQANTAMPEFRNVAYDTYDAHGAATTLSGMTNVAGRVHETLCSPFAGDYRVVRGGPCDGTGDASLVTASGLDLDEEFLGLDFYGQPLIVGSKVNIGAVAASAPAESGVHYFTPGVSYAIDGLEKSSAYGEAMYVRGASAPSAICVRDLGVRSIFNVVQSGAWSWRQYFDLAGKLYLNLPPKGSVVTNIVTIADRVSYVDPVNGNDANDGSSPTNGTGTVGPKKTMESVIYVLPYNARCVVHAAEGVYDEGTTAGGGWTNRVVLWGNQHVLLKGAGAGKSVIKGRLDTTEAAQNGCGRNAVRCVYAKKLGGYDLCVQGFTLADGAVLGNATGPSSPYEGGAFFAGESKVLSPLCQLVDCVVTNCAGSRGAVMFGGWAQRCVFRGNHLGQPGSESFRDMGMSACVVADNNPEKEGYTTAANGDLIFINTTFCGNSNTAGTYGQIGGGALIMNTVVSKDKMQDVGTGARTYCNYQSYQNKDYRGYTYVADLLLANRDTRDLRPRADSILVGGGSVGDTTVVTNMNNGLRYTSAQWFAMTTATDVNGEPNLYVNGKPVAGAYQRPTGVAQVTARVTGEITPTGATPLAEGESITVTAQGDAKRKFLGFRVDGELVETSTKTYTYTMPDVIHSAPVIIEAAYNTNWYVNATSGLDTNDGWTPETAKKTLVAAMSGPVAGDVVHAAAGVYNEGTAQDGWKSTTLCRVSVPANVTLLGDDRDGTIIEGAYPSSGEGLGADAVRAVYLAKNATLKNLTVRKGRTKSGNNAAESWGAGVLGTNRDAAFVEDCTITNCYGSRSGAGHQVTFRRCRLVGNSGASCGAAGRVCDFYNTYIAACGIADANGNSRALQDTRYFVNCTYDLDCYKANATRDLFESGMAVIVNSVILQPNCKMTNYVSGTDNVSCGLQLMRNVVVAPGTAIEPGRAFTTTFVAVNVTTNTAEEVALDPVTHVPTAGSCLIDAGDNAARNDLAGTDCAGLPRVSNGTIDIGAFEHDWRPRYGAKIGATVTTAASEAVMAEDGVYLPSGELVAQWTRDQRRLRITASVSGTGILALYVSGETPIHTWSAATQPLYKLPAQYAKADLRFRYEPGENEVGGATIQSLAQPGGCVIVR